MGWNPDLGAGLWLVLCLAAAGSGQGNIKTQFAGSVVSSLVALQMRDLGLAPLLVKPGAARGE